MLKEEYVIESKKGSAKKRKKRKRGLLKIEENVID